MDIDWFRDLILCIWGIVGVVVFILITVLFYRLYRRIRYILDSAKNASKTIQDITSYVGDEAVKPLIQVVAIIQGIRKGIEAITKLGKK